MDRLFSELLQQHTPKTNPLIMKGLATVYMQKSEEYVDAVFRSASKSFPPGLVYNGYERCTPHEEYAEITKIRNNKRAFDLARSDLYMVKYKFSYQDTPIPDRYIYLPYVSEGGIITLSGSSHHITPVLSDKVISPGFDNVFVRLLRDKIIFKRSYHTVIVDGIKDTTHVVWSKIYRRSSKDSKVPPTTKAMTTTAHYLFAKFGFSGTFQKYCGFTPVVGEADINENTYPNTDWVIVESSQVKPKSYIGDFYEPTKLRLAIPKNKWDSLTKNLVVGFFYVVDHFPNRFFATSLDKTFTWMVLLGHIVFSGHYGENRLHSSIEEHFNSLNDYVDGIITEKLAESGYRVNDFYDLLALIVKEFNNLVLESETSSLSMFGKSLEVLYYVMYDITAGIFKVNFSLSKLTGKRAITDKDVIKVFNKNMKPRSIYGLINGKVITESLSYSGDNMYAKVTSKITEQESSSGASRGKSKRLVVGEDKHIDISMVEAGSVLYLSKSNPSPTNRINPYVNIDIQTGTILPNPKFKEIRERTENLLKGRLPF